MPEHRMTGYRTDPTRDRTDRAPLAAGGAARQLRRVTLGMTGVLALASCTTDRGATRLLEPTTEMEDTLPAEVATVTMTGTSTLSVLGSTGRLTLRARDDSGAVVCAVRSLGCAPRLLRERFGWRTDVPGVVSLDEHSIGIYPNGGVWVRALAEGRVEVTASVAGVADTAVVDVVERARITWTEEALGASVGIAVGEDGTIYMAGSIGLQAVGPDGGVRWSYPASVKGLPAIAEDGTLYLGTGGGEGLTALTPDGAVLWTAPIDGIRSPPAIGPDGTLYQGTNQGTLYAVDPDGRIQWSFAAPGPLSRNPSPPAIAEDGTIYFASEDQHLYALDPDGSELWRFKAGGPARAPSIGVDGTVYFANDRITEWRPTQGLVVLADSWMFALNPDGTELWSAPLEGDVWAGPAIGFDGQIYQGTFNGGAIFVFAPGGSLLRKLPGPAGHTPIVAGDGSVYLSFGGVTGMNGDGTTKWHFNPENLASPVPAIGFDGRIYAGASDRDHVSRLYAFEELEGNNGGYRSAPWPQARGDRANTGRARAGT